MQQETGAAPPRWAWAVAVLLIGTMVVAFVAPVRFALWPATSWELFSRARSPEQLAYRVDVVASDGRVEPLPFSRLGSSHRRWNAIARSFPSMTAGERARVCRTWAGAAVELLGADRVEEVRVQRVVERAASRGADPPREVRREVVTRCAP